MTRDVDSFICRWLARNTVYLQNFMDPAAAPGALTEAPTYEFDCEPISFHRTVNGPREADELEFKMDFSNHPFDPRIIRAWSVSFYLDEVDNPGATVVPTRENCRFMGTLDKPRVMQDIKDGVDIGVKFRDYAGLFLDCQWTFGRIPIAGTLTDTIVNIASHVPGTERMTVTLDAGLADTSPGAYHNKHLQKKGKTAKQGANAWDIICDLCGERGLIAQVILDTIFIRSPETMFVTTDSSGNMRPRATARAGLLWGHDIDTLELERHMGRAKRKNIRLICTPPTSRRTLVADYPKPFLLDPGQIAPAPGTPGQAAQKPTVEVYEIRGITSQAVLNEKARNMHFERGRQEIEGKVNTFCLRDSRNRNMLGLQSADAISIQYLGGLGNEFANMSYGEVYAHLTDEDYPHELADALARLWFFMGQQDLPFFVKGVDETGDIDGGVKVSVNFANWVLLNG